MRQKKLPLLFNETERNGSFRSRLIIFSYPFWIRSTSAYFPSVLDPFKFISVLHNLL